MMNEYRSGSLYIDVDYDDTCKVYVIDEDLKKLYSKTPDHGLGWKQEVILAERVRLSMHLTQDMTLDELRQAVEAKERG